MKDFSILIGGKAGFGIDKSGMIIGRLLNQLGWRIYIYRDYPSLIRGGHTFSIIRASENKISAHQDKVNLIIAFNQESLDLHRHRLDEKCLFLFDSEQVKVAIGESCGVGVAVGAILKQENAPEIMRNTCMIGALAKAVGIDFKVLEIIIKKEFGKNDVELNLRVARRGFEEARQLVKIEPLSQKSSPLVSGNQAVALGLIKAGLDAYISYPMTPSSPILHYLAEISEDFGIDVIHPESEISVILMSLGFSYAGKRAAVGTSGGGFCLMTEGLSFAAMAELPIVIVLGQRPGPSTGLPTYSTQTELLFALDAGQGEFVRFVVAPGDAEEAYYWSAVCLNMSWKYQIPGIVLTDKNLGEGVFNFEIEAAGQVKKEEAVLWNGKTDYKRYALAENGVSSMAFAPLKNEIVKVNSYEHDEFGIITEDTVKTKAMQDKRLCKEKYLTKDLEDFEAVKVHGNKKSETALLCWGSNKGVCIEAAQKLGLKVIQPVVLSPFPVKQFADAIFGVKKLISVENNATAQLARLIKYHGFNVNDTVLKYDGRAFSVEELEGQLSGVLK